MRKLAALLMGLLLAWPAKAKEQVAKFQDWFVDCMENAPVARSKCIATTGKVYPIDENKKQDLRYYYILMLSMDANEKTELMIVTPPGQIVGNNEKDTKSPTLYLSQFIYKDHILCKIHRMWCSSMRANSKHIQTVTIPLTQTCTQANCVTIIDINDGWINYFTYHTHLFITLTFANHDHTQFRLSVEGFADALAALRSLPY